MFPRVSGSSVRDTRSRMAAGPGGGRSMTTADLVVLARTYGILLEARGEKLFVDAPAGALTPELRSALVRHKPALLALYARVTQFATLRSGLTVPAAALRLALDLEQRGYSLTLNAYRQVVIAPAR